MKLCHKCGRELPPELFPWSHTRRGDKVYSYRVSPCKECISLKHTELARKSRSKNRKAYNAYQREWRARNPGYDSRKAPKLTSSAAITRAKKKYLAKPGMRELVNQKSREYYAAHREEILRQKSEKKRLS